MIVPKPVEKFVHFYENFNVQDDIIFNEVYDKSVLFQDPFHEIFGRTGLYIYFQRTMKNVTQCNFLILDVICDRNQSSAIVTWDMLFCHKQLNRGKSITVNGCTQIKYKDKVTSHRDYFDSSQLLYRHIPVLGSVVKFLEKRI